MYTHTTHTEWLAMHVHVACSYTVINSLVVNLQALFQIELKLQAIHKSFMLYMCPKKIAYYLYYTYVVKQICFWHNFIGGVTLFTTNTKLSQKIYIYSTKFGVVVITLSFLLFQWITVVNPKPILHSTCKTTWIKKHIAGNTVDNGIVQCWYCSEYTT